MTSHESWKLRRSPRRRWLPTVVALVVLWVTLLATMAVFEDSMIFFPDRYPVGEWDVDAAARGTGATVEDHWFTASDGVRLHGWRCRPGSAGGPTSSMVLLWFHGNAGNLAQRADQMLALAERLPAEVFIVDYRGYGRSEGRPSERGLYRDGRAAWRYLTGEEGVEPGRIVVLGVSLGGAVAVDLAAEVEPAGLVVQSSFTSVPDMAVHHYPFVPRWLIRTRMDSEAKIGAVGCPILVAHSPADDVVPYELGRRLYDAATGDRHFVEIPEAAHNETWLIGGAAYLNELRGFIERCSKPGLDHAER